MPGYRTARCPNPRCRLAFPVPAAELGRNLPCPGCGQIVTLAPAEWGDRAADERRRAEEFARGEVARLPFEALLDNVRSLWNVGSIFRTADGAGLRRLHLCGITAAPPRAEISKTALGAETAVPFTHAPDALAHARELLAAGLHLVALEQSPRSSPLEAAPAAALEPPLCLIVGNEVAGVNPELLELAPVHLHLPMRGLKETLNVAVAFGVAAFAIARRLAAERPDAARAGRDRRSP